MGRIRKTVRKRRTGNVLTSADGSFRRYEHDVDKTMVQLRFESQTGTGLGAISWYAVHATSMNNSNRLVSSDNVGYASVMFERRMNPDSFVGKASDGRENKPKGNS